MHELRHMGDAQLPNLPMIKSFLPWHNVKYSQMA